MKKTMFTMTAVALGLSVAQGAQAACTDITAPELILAAQQAASNGGAVDALTISVSAVATVAKAKNKDNTPTGGYGLPMWVTMVDESGAVCYVVTTGADGGTGTVPFGVTGALAGNKEWLGSRVISAQKAFTANAFSLDGYAISTANLYSAVQENGSLYGLQFSNPVDASQAYGTVATGYGTGATDPIKGKRIGGVNVFGGGLALYHPTTGKKIGAIGVSGDTSCRDHAFAWKVRKNLTHAIVGSTLTNYSPKDGVQAGITKVNMDGNGNLQALPNGLAAAQLAGDELLTSQTGIVTTDAYWFGAWSHPACPNSANQGLSVGVINLN